MTKMHGVSNVKLNFLCFAGLLARSRLRIRKELRRTILQNVSLVYLCIQVNTEIVSKIGVVATCFPFRPPDSD
jgi:hypothetical protein